MNRFLPKFLVKDDPVGAMFPHRDQSDPRIVYRISQRAKRISIRLSDAEREVNVSLPSSKALAQAKRFVSEQKDWINIQFEALPPPQPFVPGGHALFRGEIFELVWPSEKGRPSISIEDRQIRVPGPKDSFSGRTRRLLIREARKALEDATHHYAAKLDKPIGKITVRDTSSRWGSCITRQGKGHISYSWRLVSAPPFVLDYVCAHECAHMVEDNHSKAFWDVCDSIYPEVKKAKSWLRANGAFLHAVGAEY